jgi:hypothetical protein
MSSTNPYAAPSAIVADAVPTVPPDVEKKIKSAWIAACISGVITLVVTLIAMSGTELLGFDAWSLLDVGMIFALAFGIYKRSRACAVTMLAYFVISKIILMVESGKPSGLLMALIFGYYFWQGVQGTFTYHKLKRAPLAAGQA